MEREQLIALLLGLWLLVLIAQRVRRRWERITIFEYQRGLLFRDGRFSKVLEPGAYTIYTPRASYTVLDIRPRFFSVPGQDVLSAEGITVKVSLAAQYQVVDSYAAYSSADSYHDALYLLLQTALREIAGGLTIDQLLEQRAAIGEQLTARVAPRAEALGLRLIDAGVKDLMLPGELKKIFAQTVKARKEGQAALERARGETAALRHLANAARMAEDNPTLLQLRALQALGDGAGGGNTLVLGLPATAASIPLRRGEGTSSEQRAEPQSE